MPPIKPIFISYKSEERDRAFEIRDQLQAWGYETWLDVDQIKPGDDWRVKINEGLKKSQAVVGIATKKSAQSREVKAEWDHGFSESRLILLLYEDVDLAYHLKSIQYINCMDDEAAAMQQLRDALSEPAPDLPRPIPEPASEPTPRLKIDPDSDRMTMLNKVRAMWIGGVLEPTLRENQSLTIPRSLAPDLVLHHVDFGDYRLPENADLLHLFEEMRRQLLILGDPGAGKTILMLQLAQQLIAQAQHDLKKPIPVVLNLSSWGAKPDQPLHDWLINSLNTIYGMSKTLAEKWVDGETLLLLLDGLDEVADMHQSACVDAINAFRHRYPDVDVVVCSRIKDYQKLTSRLDLRSGLLLENLTDAQISAYLSGDAYAGLREAMQTDPILREFARTPFLLNMMGMAYRDLSATSLQLPVTDDAFRARRDDLIGRYVILQFRENKSNHYTPRKVRDYLNWLAKNMVKRRQTVFQVEGLQPDWLEAKQWWRYRVADGLLFGVLVGVLFGVLEGVLEGVLWGVLWGVLVGVPRYNIKPKEQLQLNLSRAKLWELFKRGVLGVLLGVLFGGLWGGLVGVLEGGLVGVLEGVLFGVLVGVFFGVLVGVLFGVLVGVLEDKNLTSKRSINEGIKASFKNSVLLGVLLGGLLGVLLGGLFGVLVGGLFGVLVGVLVGVLSGVLVGVVRGGGEAVLQHIALRYTIHHYGYAPLNYARFLTHCTDDLHLLRRVGGSFLFRHRYLLDYFADQYREADYR